MFSVYNVEDLQHME